MDGINVSTSIPIQFEKLSEFNLNDTRFVKVKIWLMHLGENPNKSYFSKENVEKALSTLANTPILGYIEENKSGDEDFSNHRHSLEKKNGKSVFKYEGSAYGVIPETHNAKWEWKLCDDGVDREFLTCEGLVWTKWDGPVDILNRDFVKAQSMELHPDYKGYYDNKTKLFHFTDFQFNGACFLGEDYNPGMVNASIEVINFSDAFEQIKSDFKEEVSRMVAAFTEFEARQHQEIDDPDPTSFESIQGGNTVEEKLQLLSKYNFTRETVEAKGINFEAISVDELEAELTKFAAEANPGSTDDTNTDFSLTNGQLRTELERALNPNPKKDEWGWDIYEYYYSDSTNDVVVAWSVSDRRLVGFGYTMDGDKPVIDFTSVKPYKLVPQPMEGFTEHNDIIVPAGYAEYMKNVAVKKAEAEFTASNKEAMDKLQSEFETLKASHETLTQEATELREFKANTLATSRKQEEDALFAEFADQLSDEEMKPVKDKASEYATIDEMRVNLFALVGMKAHKEKGNFSAGKQGNGGIRVKVDGQPVTQNNSRKPYADLIEQTVGKNK